MTHCPTELSLVMHADRANEAAIADQIERHLVGCADCRARIDALRRERLVVAEALSIEVEPATVPAFRPPRARGARIALGVGILAGALLVEHVPPLLARLLEQLLPAEFAWLDPLDSGIGLALVIRTATFLVRHGDDLMTSIAYSATVAIVLGLLGWAVFALRKRISGPLMLFGLVMTAASLPTPAHAIDFRHVREGQVLVAADESIDDTLVVFGETVEIDGSVTGDLIAVARRVAIRGTVGGQIIAAGESVTIGGEVGGSVMAAGETVSVSAPRIARNLYAAGETVSVTSGARVEQNALMAGERVSVEGPIGRDVLGAAEELEVSSSVGGTLTTYAERVTLLATARIAGDVNSHSVQPGRLTVSPGAVIGGAINEQVHAHAAKRSDYLDPGFYAKQLLRLGAAFVTGAIVLGVFPILRAIAFDTAADTLTAGSVGLIAMVATPIIAVLAAVTIVGLPLGLVGLAVWASGIYLAKIVVAHFVGVRILGATSDVDHFLAALAVGLVAVIVAINVPFIGTAISVVLMACGLGALGLLCWRRLRDERGGPAF